MTYHPDQEKPLTPEEVNAIAYCIGEQEEIVRKQILNTATDDLRWLMKLDDDELKHQIDLFGEHIRALRNYERILAKLEYMVREEVPF